MTKTIEIKVDGWKAWVMAGFMLVGAMDVLVATPLALTGVIKIH